MADREKVIKSLEICSEDITCDDCEYQEYHGNGCFYKHLMKDALELLKERIDLVRCKDCKWWDKKDGSSYGYCHACKHGHHSEHWEIGIYRLYKGDWFCADGERRANNDKELSEEDNKETGE